MTEATGAAVFGSLSTKGSTRLDHSLGFRVGGSDFSFHLTASPSINGACARDPLVSYRQIPPKWEGLPRALLVVHKSSAPNFHNACFRPLIVSRR